MKTSTYLLALLAALLWVSSPSANAGQLIYSQLSDNQSAYGPSQSWPANGVNSEVADEFNVVANIDRVSAGGFIWGTVNFQGAYVRFYEFGADNKPGALQREYFFAAGDPNLVFDQNGGIDATLSPVFTASGRHFLSVQPVINYWYWWSSSSGAPRGEAFYFRNNAIGEAWHHGDDLNSNINADVVFSLYGTVTGAGVITSLSENILPRSGFLKIFGNNFGGGGTVLIGGINAPVANWTSTRIIAYVPESAPLGTLSVQVVSGAGPSNTIPLNVTPRPPSADHVNWRFQMNGPYSFVRPAISPDGTVYVIDAFDHLYALAPDGGLKWVVSGAGDKGVAVGSDGTIYVASEDFIKAFNPDGSSKWNFVQNPRAFICLGVSVGPDGNIYSVGTQGMGVFSLTPAGALRWQTPEAYDRRIVDYAEILFGQNGGNQQLIFAANNHLRALRLDGTSVFTIPGWYGQPAVGPDGSIHAASSAYSPNGNLLWNFGDSGGSPPADVGSDGIHYFDSLFALNTDGSLRWHAALTDYVAGVIVDPQNTRLILGSTDTLDHAGFLLATSAQDGHELWRVILPIEDPTVWNPAIGAFGFNQFVTTRVRFTADGQTAFVHTATATGDNDTSRSFVYSLNAGNGPPPPPSPTPTPTATSTPTPAPTVTPTPTPTPAMLSISGTVVYCSNPSLNPVPNVTLTLTGTMGSSTLSDGSGNYTFSSLPSGGNYTVTPSKTALTPGSAGINTVDVVATQRHFLNLGTPLSGCRLTAADVNGDNTVNTIDAIAIQRFVLIMSTGIANTGKYQFTPVNRTYPGIVSNQTAQNYDTLIFGDVASGFVNGPEGPSQTAARANMNAGEVAATVAGLALPEVAVDQSKGNFIAAVKTSEVDAKNKLVGFQGDFNFDERVVTFPSQPVQKAGLTVGNWNVEGNVLPGTGPIRTLRVSAFSTGFAPLSGSGTLFELRMTRVSTAAQGTPLIWAAPADHFIFIDADLNTQKPGNAAPGSVTAYRVAAHDGDFTVVPPDSGGETITVTTLDDVSDFSGLQQVSDLPGPDGRVSFREAVTAANNTAGPQTIAFAIPVAEFWLVPGVALLRLEQGAFFLNDSGTTVDFSTQTTNIGDTNPNGPEVGFYGLEPNGWGIAAIYMNGENCVIKGLGKVYQRGYAVRIVGNHNRVIGCQIDGPLHAAVAIEGYMGSPAPSDNTVGGTAPGEGNILTGLVIDGPAESNIVIGNPLLIGVEVRGATQYGVIARNNRIGGSTPAERNIISGAGSYGEEGFPDGAQISIIDADGTIVEGNYIGTTVDGMARYPQIGPVGVEVWDSRGTTIRGNLIAGLRTPGVNHYAGQIFGQAVYVGATNANTQATVIQGNTIGLAADGLTPIVTRSGIVVSPLTSSHHAFGTLIASNHIASVETTGVIVASPENGVTITGNSIHDCGDLGIDLFFGSFAGVGGVTPNDPGDGDTGGNGLQNFPVLLSATTTGSSVMVQGTLDSSPSGQFTVEFFASPSCDPSGFGEGAVFLGSTSVTTDGAGHAAFSLTLPAAVAVGAKATATTTRLSTGDTSEFSACVAVTSGGTPTPTPPGMVSISGTVVYCSNPSLNPVPNVTLTLTGTMGSSTLSDGSGNYTFSSLPSGGNYTVTPAKIALTPGSAGINTVDVVATQRHFLNLGTPLSGCRLTAADVNGDNTIDTIDTIAIQRFVLMMSTGIANTGKYQFTPVNRSYLALSSNQTAQNYDALIFGDVASGFVNGPEGPSQTAAGADMSASEGPAMVAELALPEVASYQSKGDFIAAVTTSAIDAKNKLVGFQGDFTFDERVVTFQSDPVQNAGLTAGNWHVSGNVLPGAGPIRTLRVSAFSTDFAPLSGSGTLFELRTTRVSKATQGTPLIWGASPDQFFFIDADLNAQKPGNAAFGGVTLSGERK